MFSKDSILDNSCLVSTDNGNYNNNNNDNKNNSGENNVEAQQEK